MAMAIDPLEWSSRWDNISLLFRCPKKSRDYEIDFLELYFAQIVRHLRRHQIVDDPDFDPISMGC